MKKIEVKVNDQELEQALTDLNKLKATIFDTSKMNVQVSKGKAITAQEGVFKAIKMIDENLGLLIDETINLTTQVKQEFVEFDETYADLIK